MRVLMRTNLAGPAAVISAGKAADLPDDLAGRLIAAGYAQALETPPIVHAIVGAGAAQRRRRATAGPGEVR